MVMLRRFAVVTIQSGEFESPSTRLSSTRQAKRSKELRDECEAPTIRVMVELRTTKRCRVDVFCAGAVLVRDFEICSTLVVGYPYALNYLSCPSSQCTIVCIYQSLSSSWQCAVAHPGTSICLQRRLNTINALLQHMHILYDGHRQAP